MNPRPGEAAGKNAARAGVPRVRRPAGSVGLPVDQDIAEYEETQLAAADVVRAGGPAGTVSAPGVGVVVSERCRYGHEKAADNSEGQGQKDPRYVAAALLGEHRRLACRWVFHRLAGWARPSPGRTCSPGYVVPLLATNPRHLSTPVSVFLCICRVWVSACAVIPALTILGEVMSKLKLTRP